MCGDFRLTVCTPAGETVNGNRKLEARAAAEHADSDWRGATASEERVTNGVHIHVQNPSRAWQPHDEIFLPPFIDDQKLWGIEVNNKP
jgi:hypothetical protein